MCLAHSLSRESVSEDIGTVPVTVLLEDKKYESNQ